MVYIGVDFLEEGKGKQAASFGDKKILRVGKMEWLIDSGSGNGIMVASSLSMYY